MVRDTYAQLDVPAQRTRESVRAISNGDMWPNNVLVKHDDQVGHTGVSLNLDRDGLG